MNDILRLSLPLSLWLVGFSAVYALQGLSCSRHWPAEFDARTLLLGAWAIAILVQVLGLAAVLLAPSRSPFVQTAATMLAATGLGAAVWTLMPVLAASLCQ